MFKYAFIFNTETLTPQTCSYVYENDDFYCKVAAVSSMEMCKDYAKKLAEEGIQLIDLCGDFDELKAKEIEQAINGQVEVCYAKYTEEEGNRVAALPSLSEYGIIVKAPGIGQEPVKIELTSNECNTYVAFVSDEKMAQEAALDMVSAGIYFIELCSYFTKEKADQVADSIQRKVPIGYCG